MPAGDPVSRIRRALDGAWTYSVPGGTGECVVPVRDTSTVSAEFLMLGVAPVRVDTCRVAIGLSSTDIHHSEIEPLTGLLNRRGFVESVTPLLGRAHADDLSAALLLVDIDRFKVLNDSYGHQAGDRLLREVAARRTPLQTEIATLVRWFAIGGGALSIALAICAARGRNPRAGCRSRCQRPAAPT